MTLAEEIEELAEEPVEAVTIGGAGWGSDYGLESFEPLYPDRETAPLLAWAEARPWLDHAYDHGYGAPNLYQFCAWTEHWVVFPSQYDGATATCPGTPRPASPSCRAVEMGEPIRGTFVYGTLRAGGGLDGLVPRGTARETVRAEGRIWLASERAMIPVMTVWDAEPGDWVVGELLDANPGQMPQVTEIEEGAGYHVRVVRLEDGRRCWAYVVGDEWHGPRIWTGDWNDPYGIDDERDRETRPGAGATW